MISFYFNITSARVIEQSSYTWEFRSRLHLTLNIERDTKYLQSNFSHSKFQRFLDVSKSQDKRTIGGDILDHSVTSRNSNLSPSVEMIFCLLV